MNDLTERYRRLHAGSAEEVAAELDELAACGREVVAVSACLLGVRCRYDGGDKRNDAAVARVAGQAEILPVCPEVLAGFGVPRPAITLAPDGRALNAGGKDVTTALESGAERANAYAERAGAVRALLKEGSPSCGSRRVLGRLTARLSGRGLPIVNEE